MAFSVEGLDVDCQKLNAGIRQVGKVSKDFHGICDRLDCRCLKLMLRLNQGQPRQSGKRDGGKDRERNLAPVRASDEAPEEGARARKVRYEEPEGASASWTTGT